MNNFQKADIDQLNLICDLGEKHRLWTTTNLWKRSTIWDQITADFVRITNIEKTSKELNTKWTNQMNKLRGWERSIAYAKNKTGSPQ